MTRILKGIPPTDDRWSLATSFQHDGCTWLMYAITHTWNTPWLNCKLVADGDVPHKANYWMSWNFKDRRFNNNADFKIMLQHSPTLLDRLVVAIDFVASEKRE